MDQFQWFKAVALLYFSFLLVSYILQPLLMKFVPQNILPIFNKIVSIRGRQFIFRFIQNFFTFMSGYVTSNCFRKITNKRILTIFAPKKMNFCSKLFYSIRNCNRFLITPMFVKMLWTDYTKNKFKSFYNLEFIYFILGFLGDLLNIFFCIGQHFACFYKLKIYQNSLQFHNFTYFSNISWALASIFYIIRDLVGFYMLNKSITEDKDNFLRGFLIIDLIQNICQIICAYQCIFQGSISNEAYGIYGMILSICLWILFCRKKQQVPQIQNQKQKMQKKQN